MATRKKKKDALPAKKMLTKPKKAFIKPSGIRVEDLKPSTILKFTMGDREEIHLALDHPFGTRPGADLHTWCLAGSERSPCADLLIGEVAWNYKIEILGLVNSKDVAEKLIRACKNSKNKKPK